MVSQIDFVALTLWKLFLTVLVKIVVLSDLKRGLEKSLIFVVELDTEKKCKRIWVQTSNMYYL